MIAIVIPARYESTRFPGKPLATIAGKTMIERVIESALLSKLADKIIVATEDIRIQDFVTKLSLSNKVQSCLTSRDHACGTDRISEVIRKFNEINYVVNFQGDEPLMPGIYADKVITALTSHPEIKPSDLFMSSLVAPISDLNDLTNPNIVKTVMDNNNFALYFSRSTIPYLRNKDHKHIFYRHLGIYGYTRETILRFTNLAPSSLEIAEQLEQLRMLQNGIKIKLDIVDRAYPAVDVPDDILVVEKELINL